MRRRLAFIVAAALAAVVLVIAALPFWLGAVARAVGASRGFTFGTYERLGYARFALHDVEVKHGTVRVTASRVEADTPLLWTWRHWRGNDAPVAAEKWSVEVEPPAAPKPPSPDRGWMRLRGQLQRIATQLDRWLPRASAGPGFVRWHNGELSLNGAKWGKRQLAVAALTYRNLKVDAVADFADADMLKASAQTPEGALTLVVESRGENVSGQFTVWRQPAALSAVFGPRGWLPNEASLNADQWKIPAANLKLGQFYENVHGHARLEWRESRIVAEVDAGSDPLPGKSAPPLTLVARAHGDGETFSIESLRIAVPGINAQLTEPVTIDRTGKIQESAARFAVDADLAKQPWFAARGSVKGEARVLGGFGATSPMELSLEAHDVVAKGVQLSSVSAQGRLEWPKLQITTGTLTGASGERIEWRGGWDFKTKEVLAAVVEGQIRRNSVARWLPQQPEFDAVKISGRASGPLASLTHEGELEATAVTFRGVKPLALHGTWRGRSGVVESFEMRAAAGATVVTAGGRVDANGLTLQRLDLQQADAPRLRLAAPATLRWRPRLQLDGVRLVGPEGELNLSAELGPTGKVGFSIVGFSSQWLADIVSLPGPTWQLNSLALLGSWDRGPMVFSLSTVASLDIGEERKASVMVSARGDRTGVRVEALRATEGNSTVVNATGRVPLTISPAAAPLVRIDQAGALAVDAEVAPNSAFWQKLATLSGVELQEPAASAHLAGTWRQPQGNVTLKAARIAIDPKRMSRPLPAISQLDVKVNGDANGLALETFSVAIEGQVVRAEGRLPLPSGGWGELFKQPLMTARRGADLRIEIPEADVAVFARFLPAVLAPKGRVQADLRYRSGGVEGFLKLRDAASRPLGPLGVLQEVSADIALSGRKLALRGVTARSGGQPVALTGTVELPEGGGAPRFDLALKGDNLPFVRQTGLLVRGDLDLKLQTPPAPTGAVSGPARLSGTVRLRDSLFLADVRSFLPKGGAGPTRRPPYFAIETPPANAWQLAVDVAGDEFMRLRTPVFTGVASAHFRLTGTLAEPRAIGEATVDEGRVRMPFASFEVKQGSVRLTEADPYEPAIYLRATGRRYDYDLTMEIDGKATAPNVTFTSSPGLDSEQVLLMVMTGAAPNDEVTKSRASRFAGVGAFLGQSLLGNLLGASDDADRLTFEQGEKISRQGGEETYRVEYKLSDRWTLMAERNEFDEYNAGVKWRVFGGKRETESNGDAKK